MGWDFRPQRVYQDATKLLQMGRLRYSPSWFRTVGEYPPSEALVRPQPVQHRQPRPSKKWKKPSRMFQPQRIAYEEDNLRHEFFGDHPWELARPRIFLEDDGKDYQKWDWSKSYEPGRPVSGESVVQRQRWLLNQTRVVEEDGKKKRVPIYTTEKAYDKARKEFYEMRHLEAVEQRVAREEALSTGAYFGKTVIDVGMELENETFEKWKVWADEQVTAAEQARSAAYASIAEASEDSGQEAFGDTLEAATEQLQAVSPSVPGTKQGQDALGGAAIHP